MAETAIVSVKKLNDDQIENLVAKFRDAVSRHSIGLDADAFQQVLDAGDIGLEMFALLRARAEPLGKMIVRRVKVNRRRAPGLMLYATGRKMYIRYDKDVKAIPRGEGKEVEVVIFKLEPWECITPGFVGDDDLEEALGRRGLKACDPYSLAAFNAANPAFADERPNRTHWQTKDGDWSSIAFGMSSSRRYVSFNCLSSVCGDGMWFAGLCK